MQHSIIPIIGTVVLLAALFFCYYKPKPKGGRCWEMDQLKLFKKSTIVYPPNIHRQRAIVKTWNIAVRTAEPEDRFETHAAWMLHILLEHTATIVNIADMESSEAKQSFYAYKQFDVENRTTVKSSTLKRHEQ